MGRKGKGKERERGGEGLRYGCSGMDAPVRCYRKELTFNYLYWIFRQPDYLLWRPIVTASK